MEFRKTVRIVLIALIGTGIVGCGLKVNREGRNLESDLSTYQEIMKVTDSVSNNRSVLNISKPTKTQLAACKSNLAEIRVELKVRPRDICKVVELRTELLACLEAQGFVPSRKPPEIPERCNASSVVVTPEPTPVATAPASDFTVVATEPTPVATAPASDFTVVATEPTPVATAPASDFTVVATEPTPTAVTYKLYLYVLGRYNDVFIYSASSSLNGIGYGVDSGIRLFTRTAETIYSGCNVKMVNCRRPDRDGYAGTIYTTANNCASGDHQAYQLEGTLCSSNIGGNLNSIYFCGRTDVHPGNIHKNIYWLQIGSCSYGATHVAFMGYSEPGNLQVLN